MRRQPGRSTGRPLLLPLVYLATLTLIGVSCAAVALLGAEHVRTTATMTTVAGDQAAIGVFVASEMTTADLEPTGPTVERRQVLERALTGLRASHGYRLISVARPDGTLIAGDDPSSALGAAHARSVEQGRISATITEPPEGDPILTEAIPITRDGRIQLVVSLERDASGVIAAAASAGRDLIAVAVGAAVVLAVLLRTIFHAAGIRLREQAEELIQARRRDPVTGLINHGAGAARLTEILTAAKHDGASFGIALVDIDNFRMLNETYGSPAGDEALRVVAGGLQAESGPWLALARFGPDEFLAIAPAAVDRELPAAMDRVHAALDAATLQFEDSERLPLTVSVGITYFPFHATGVNELLSAATIALGEAKAGGGNQTVIADAWVNEPKTTRSNFDVLQGLVVTIDHKDRYTKRHSEDVACYALFLATRLGLDDQEHAILRTAGLLHDIGKIGVPDDILRKPGA